jgi:hypothetical protein
MTRLPFALSVLVLVGACGGDDSGDDVTADANRPPDAGAPDAAPPCPTCEYTPEPLAAGEISAAEQQALAERFNPAHVYTNPVIFATPVDYALEHNELGLQRGVVLQKGPYWAKVDPATIETVMGIDLLNDDWSTLPVTNMMGQDLVYFVDTPGDNTGPGATEESWTTEWEAAGGKLYPPTQYAHFFWLSKADGYLAIQYWSFYPWNKFGNNHEGDWEHVNVVVQKQADDDWHLVMAHYSFHARQTGLLADDLVRVADKAGGPGNGDHIVVFVGGKTCQPWGGPPEYCGDASGASFAYPGLWPYGTANEMAAGGTSLATTNMKHANDFTIVVLPREDEPVAAKLSWYKLPFLAGQLEVDVNADVVKSSSSHRSPLAPNHYHFEFEEAIPMPFDPFTGGAQPEPFTPPNDWTMLNNPTTTF